MHFPTLATVALSAGIVAADSGFYSTCHNYNKIGRPTGTYYMFTADCKKAKGLYEVSKSIKLDSCFGNSGGRLVAQLQSVNHTTLASIRAWRSLLTRPSGGFGGSCRKATRKGSWLHAECGDGKGGWPATSIDMSSFTSLPHDQFLSLTMRRRPYRELQRFHEVFWSERISLDILRQIGWPSSEG